MTPTALPVLADVVRSAVEREREARPLIALVPDASTLFFRRAEPSDAAAIHALQQAFVARGLLLPRSIEQIYRTIRDFVVAEQDGQVVGSASLRIYSAELAEVGALAVAEDVQGTGVGRRLVETLLHDARVLGLRRVFALTLQDGFFHRLGFRTTLVAEFPAKIAADCSGCDRRDRCDEIAVDIVLQP
jgi:amino-acid N-acetyltransferase